MKPNKNATDESATSSDEQQDNSEKKPLKKGKKQAFDFKSIDFNQLMDFDKIKTIISGMNETQLSISAGAIFLVGYLIYEFVLLAPAQPVNTMTPTVMAPATQGETAEQRFKRENKDAKLPDGSALSAETIKEKTQLTQQTPFGDKELEFRIRLPKNWVMSEFARYGLPGEEKYKVLTNIARYFGPTILDTRPFVWVETERMTRFMTAETWMQAYMIKRGISPQAVQVTDQKEVQALYVDIRDLQSYAVRTLFRIEGDLMVMTSFGVPIDYYNDYKDIMGLSLGSFSLVRSIERDVEMIKEYRLLNVIRFSHYLSWLPKNEWAESTLRPFLELHNPQERWNEKGDKLQGIIFINVWRNGDIFTPEKNMEEIRQRLLRLNMTLLDDSKKTTELPLRRNFETITRYDYLARVNNYIRKDQFDIVKSEESMTNQEVSITVMDNGYYTAYITLVSPLRGTSYVIWAQNQAAYDLLLDTLDIRGAPSDLD